MMKSSHLSTNAFFLPIILLLLIVSPSCGGECGYGKHVASRVDGYEYTVQFNVKRLIYREYDNNEELLFESSIDEGVGVRTDDFFESTDEPPSFEDGFTGSLTIREDPEFTAFVMSVYVGPDYNTLDLNESISVAPDSDSLIQDYNTYLGIGYPWINDEYYDFPLLDEYGNRLDFESSETRDTVIANIAEGYQIIAPFEPSFYDYEEDGYVDTGRFVEIEFVIDDMQVVEGPNATEQVECIGD